MKPVSFAIERPASLAEAAKLLAGHDGAAKIIAGGQSLGPMLNLRLTQPNLLIDITGIPELTRVESGADHLTLGACITTADMEDGRIGAGALATILARVARLIAYRAVRNRGTVGGSLCHADPAADWMTALAALGADAVVADGTRERLVPVARLMRGAFETDINSGEILQAIRIPKVSSRARWGYYKVCRKVGEFALAIGAIYSDSERGAFRAVMGATSGAPVVIDDASVLFGGVREPGPSVSLDEAAATDLLAATGNDVDTVRRRLHLSALSRAVDEARGR
jgi:carbon-monoxide dehydrogenase medium subunit